MEGATQTVFKQSEDNNKTIVNETPKFIVPIFNKSTDLPEIVPRQKRKYVKKQSAAFNESKSILGMAPRQKRKYVRKIISSKSDLLSESATMKRDATVFEKASKDEEPPTKHASIEPHPNEEEDSTMEPQPCDAQSQGYVHAMDYCLKLPTFMPRNNSKCNSNKHNQWDGYHKVSQCIKSDKDEIIFVNWIEKPRRVDPQSHYYLLETISGAKFFAPPSIVTYITNQSWDRDEDAFIYKRNERDFPVILRLPKANLEKYREARDPQIIAHYE